ncbi:DUF262 domain-containing protein [Streptomyces sp. NBC_01171]|uniref:GmrSD restriction endonuclease domain-containing protein n=1 Tax=Streptomyces sp. NBC_01171 TaxID=2903757 RepID=UPI003863D326|nr:DUF262 domain-containing protein [Streptomyces sp. NBC_01171]
MQISQILHKIDSGDIALPEFQRGYVWTRDQVRAFVQSLYRGYPIGGFLTWSTKARPPCRRLVPQRGPHRPQLLLAHFLRTGSGRGARGPGRGAGCVPIRSSARRSWTGSPSMPPSHDTVLVAQGSSAPTGPLRTTTPHGRQVVEVTRSGPAVLTRAAS